MENHKNVSIEFLISRLEMKNKKFCELLQQKEGMDIFHEKCNKFISDEMEMHIMKMTKKTHLSDGAQDNYFEELKVKLLDNAIKRLKPLFHTI